MIFHCGMATASLFPKLPGNVTVSGAIIYPGITAFKPGLNYHDYIQIAGGFSEKARQSKLQIIRPRTGSWYDADKNFPIREGDIIFVPEKPIRDYWIIARETLTVLYQVAATVAIVINVSK